MITNTCPVCNKIYTKKYRTTYCSLHCFGITRIGKMSGENSPSKRADVRLKISKGLTGKTPSLETRKKMSLAKIGKPGYWTGKKRLSMIGEKNWKWKGDNVGYIALHNWVSRKLGKPSICENCGTTTAPNYEWANISGKYKRDIYDWKRLCVSCHMKMDNQHKKMWITIRSKNVK